MKYLLIDIGHTDIKAGSAARDSHNVTFLKRFTYSNNSFQKDFEKNFSSIKKKEFPKAGVSVQSKRNRLFICKYFEKIFSAETVFIGRDMKLPVKIEYSAELGIDRICNASASHIIYKRKNILIIDFGTATTFTLLSDGVIKGGIITSGINTSLFSLTEKTTLPEVKLNFPERLINKNTKDNIRAGILYQSLFSAERIITELKKDYRKLFVISTGGMSEIISGKTRLINVNDLNLTLKGINVILSQ